MIVANESHNQPTLAVTDNRFWDQGLTGLRVVGRRDNTRLPPPRGQQWLFDKGKWPTTPQQPRAEAHDSREARVLRQVGRVCNGLNPHIGLKQSFRTLEVPTPRDCREAV